MRILLIAALLLNALLGPQAHAEKADHDKPANVEADRVSVDDKQKLQVFQGNVRLTQGTLLIRTDHLVVTQDALGFQKGVASGGENGIAHFRQKREGKDEYVEGAAERIEHDDRADTTEFFGRAAVKSGLDEVRGNYIFYDAKTENYLVTSAPGAPGANPAVEREGRVHAVIQPKPKEGGPAVKAAPAKSKTPEPAPLKAASEVKNLRPESNP